MANLEARVRSALDRIQSRDRALGEELRQKREQAATEDKARRLRPMLESALEGREPVAPQLGLETIVLRTGRPVLAVQRDEPRLEFRDAESEIWRERLQSARRHLVQAIRAVGRIELQHNPRFEWVGTGWLVRPDIVVTNRHVAAEFARRQGDRFVFRQGSLGLRMKASIDFLEEFDRADSLAFDLNEVLHIEDDGPDLAFLRVSPRNGAGLAAPINLSASPPEIEQLVAVIGYPARDSRIPDLRLMEEIFGDVFDKKRLAPGQISGGGELMVEHDCSTLGGNSGSVVLDLNSGEALAVHFAGRFLEANFAVPARIVADRLERLGRRPAPPAPRPETGQQPQTQAAEPSPAAGSRAVTYTIPLHITIDLGEATAGQARSAAAPARPAPARPGETEEEEDDELLLVTEARPEDYEDRTGYDADFLGGDANIPLPEIVRDASKVLTFQTNGATERELRYRHFSVVMNRERRLCFFSAVNIDGSQTRKGKRPGWRLDPRIPEKSQIIRECYGNEPKFSRGHMTRREDPIWGGKADAEQGNADSMHVTNAVPQMQPFNAGIWLGLEDYALENAREDDMRICVFTGPFLRSNDPVRFGVKIPRSFWKVIAFIHDDSGELSATGYTISQDDFLREEEFVFGRYETFQVPISQIERQAGLSFGEFASLDPLRRVEEALAAPLRDFRQIRFSAR
jgi:endonuclease G